MASGFGSIRKLPSGRYQARYRTPDGERRSAPSTFANRRDAGAWLARQQTELAEGVWRDPQLGREPFGDYAERWLHDRQLKPRTRAHYRAVLDQHVLPTFAKVPMVMITPQSVRTWHAAMNADTPTMRAHAYSLLRGVLASAVSDDLIVANPCRIRGASSAKRKVEIEPATLKQLETLAEKMPGRLRMIVVLAAWLGLRFGELTELRRSDVDLDARKVWVRRGVVRLKGEYVVGDPKSEAGKRSVAIPRHLIEPLRDHLAEHCGPEPDALLFTGVKGGYLSPASLYDHYYPAREAAGRPDLRFHDLRHTGAVLAAQTGATLADLMRRLGHSTPAAAMRYQHSGEDRDLLIADALADFADAKVVPLRSRRSAG